MKILRLGPVLVVLTLILAACPAADTGDDASSPPATTDETAAEETTGGSPAETGGAEPQDPETACAEDEFGCVEIADGDPLLLGTALVITTADASLGLDSQYGAEVGRSLRPQIMGRDVEFDHQDDTCSAEGGTAAATALSSIPEIVAVIGTSCSGAGIPAAEILSSDGILMVSPSNTAPSLTSEATHQPFYARTAHNDEVQGLAMAQFVCEELGHATAATVHDGSPYAEQLQAVFATAFQEECDGEITLQEAITEGQTDFSGVLSSIGESQPDFFYYPIFVAEGALLTQQARTTAGLEETDLAGADGMFADSFLEAAGDASEGMYLSGPDLDFAGDFYEDEFIPAYAEISGEDRPISVFHAHAFDAYNMIADAIEEVAIEGDDGTLYIPRTALRDAFFATEGYEGITGTLTCDETGDCADPRISVSQVQEGAFERIWPEETE